MSESEDLGKEELDRLKLILNAFESYPERIDGLDGIAQVLGTTEEYVRKHHFDDMMDAGILLLNRNWTKKSVRRKWITFKRLLFVYLIKKGYI